MDLDQVRVLQLDKHLHLLDHTLVLGVVVLNEIALNTLGTKIFKLLDILDVLANA